MKKIYNVPSENAQIFEMLYFLETALREFIIETLEKKHGVKWYKQSIPSGEMLKTYLNARTYDKSRPWVSNTPHHPIYYLDFPDLATLIEKKDNWESVFKVIFKRKEIIISELRKVEPIRNKIAHNRKATTHDVKTVKGALESFIVSIGESKMKSFSDKCTKAVDIFSRLNLLVKLFHSQYLKCIDLSELENLEFWLQVKNEWWFDDDYLGIDVENIRLFFEALEEYSKIPRERGKGFILERWKKNSNIESKYSTAVEVFNELIEEYNNE